MSLGDAPFSSNATDKATFFQDMAQHALHSYALAGLVPPSLGISKSSGEPISSSGDLLDVIDGWFAQQRQFKGGASTDTLDTPVGDTYAARRRAWLSHEEGVREWAYDDQNGQRVLPGQKAGGNVTVGIGFNMDDPSSRSRFAAALPGIDFDAIRSGRQPLNQAQIDQLFDKDVQGFEKIVDDRVGGANLNEHQRLALLSMAYNGPSLLGPNVVNAVLSGHGAQAIRSAGGNAARRYREAGLFAGPVDAPRVLPPYQG